LAGLVRGELTKLARGVLCALITIDVHARDIITEMVVSKVSPPVFCHYDDDYTCSISSGSLPFLIHLQLECSICVT